MLELLSTLIKGTNARAIETATDVFAIDLINQKIREAEAGVNNAKQALASLIMRQRAEETALGALRYRKSVMEDRVRKALAAGNDALAHDGAIALAEMENEEAARADTVAKVMIPMLMPYGIAALRVSYGVCWKIALISELFGAQSGLGYLMLQAQSVGDVTTVVATCFAIVILFMLGEVCIIDPIARTARADIAQSVA